jgi:hypothetical protein
VILTKEQQASFAAVTEPLIKWFNENAHPHATVLVTPTSAELLEGVATHRTEQFVKD